MADMNFAKDTVLCMFTRPAADILDIAETYGTVDLPVLRTIDKLPLQCSECYI